MEDELFKRKERLMDALTDDLYFELLDFFQEVASSHGNQFVVLMARKCYDLFQSYRPILEDETGISDELIITSDRAFGRYKSIITSDTKVLVVDDTMLYGRTVKEFVEQLHGSYHIPYENIELAVYAATYERQEKSGDLPYFQNVFFCYQNDAGESVSIKVLERTLFFVESGSARRYSSRFLDAIHGSSTPFVSYIPGFSFTDDEWVSSIEPKLSEEKWEKIDITLQNEDEDEKWLTSFCYVPIEKPLKEAEFSCIRIYRNLKMGKVLFVPYIILPSYERYVGDLNLTVDSNATIQYLIGEIKDHDEAIDEGYYLTLAASYVYGAEIIRQCGVSDPQSHLVENGCFPSEQFGRIVTITLPQLKSILDSSLFQRKEFRDDSSVYKSSIEDIENTFQQNKGKELFQILQKCFYQFLLRDNPENPANRTSGNPAKCRDKGLPLSIFVEKVKEFANVYSEPEEGEAAKVFSDRDIYATVIKLIDSGCASLYLCGGEGSTNAITCYIRDGEGAMTIMSNLCPGLSYAIYTIYTRLRDDWGNIKETTKKYVKRYLEVHGGKEISWSDVNTIMDSPNPGEYYMYKEEELFPSEDERADYFVAFSLAYVDYMKHEGRDGQMSFQEYLLSMGESFFTGEEEYYILLKENFLTRGGEVV
jgi:hypothetical protein